MTVNFQVVKEPPILQEIVEKVGKKIVTDANVTSKLLARLQMNII